MCVGNSFSSTTQELVTSKRDVHHHLPVSPTWEGEEKRVPTAGTKKNMPRAQKTPTLSAANWTETPNFSPRPLGRCQIQTFHCFVSLGEAQLDNPERETLTNRNETKLFQKTSVASPDKLLMSSCPIKFWKAWFIRHSFQFNIWGFLFKTNTGKFKITCWQTHTQGYIWGSMSWFGRKGDFLPFIPSLELQFPTWELSTFPGSCPFNNPQHIRRGPQVINSDFPQPESQTGLSKWFLFLCFIILLWRFLWEKD